MTPTQAELFGLKRIDLCGMLIEAKSRGLIAAVKPVLDQLITEAGFRVPEQVYNHVLEVS